MKQISLLLLFAVAVLASACKKDDPKPANPGGGNTQPAQLDMRIIASSRGSLSRAYLSTGQTYSTSSGSYDENVVITYQATAPDEINTIRVTTRTAGGELTLFSKASGFSKADNTEDRGTLDFRLPSSYPVAADGYNYKLLFIITDMKNKSDTAIYWVSPVAYSSKYYYSSDMPELITSNSQPYPQNIRSFFGYAQGYFDYRALNYNSVTYSTLFAIDMINGQPALVGVKDHYLLANEPDRNSFYTIRFGAVPSAYDSRSTTPSQFAELPNATATNAPLANYVNMYGSGQIYYNMLDSSGTEVLTKGIIELNGLAPFGTTGQYSVKVGSVLAVGL